MKKKLLKTCSLFIMIGLFTMTLQAATYSQTKSTTLSLGGANFKLSEKATFNTSSGVYWSYSNKALSYTGGTMYPINSNATSRTISEISNGSLNTAIREYKVTATNQSYRDFVSSTRLTWRFDSSSKTWK